MTSERASLYYAGFIIVLGLILGGGTMQGLWSDRVIQVALIPATLLGLGQLDESRWGNSAKLLAVLIVILCAAQFLPIGRPWPDPTDPAVTSALLTMAAGRSLESALHVIPLLGFALFVSRFNDIQREQLIRFFVLGLLVNLGVGSFQLSASGPAAYATTFLPFEIRAGLFTNQNHFSTLVFSLIPMLGYFYLARDNRPLAFVILLAISMLYLFAVGSGAGMGISLVLATMSFALFSPRPRSRRLRYLLMAMALLASAAILLLVGGSAALNDQTRLQIAGTTLQAIGDHWLIGTGIGSFENVYGIYQDPASVTNLYVNHAHNDYLEIILETGIAGLILLVAFFALVFGSPNSAFRSACKLAILAIAVHSLVDYPLRTFGIGVLFAFLAACVLQRRQSDPALRRSQPQS